MKTLKPMIVLSFDGLATQDLDFFKNQPAFNALLQRASGCKYVKSIYPSITYAAHATIVTGCYPKTHGIVDNTFLEPHRSSPDWYWRHDQIKMPTFYDAAQDAGYKVAALLWPTTARSAIDINIPEIFANRPYHHQIFVSLRNGSVGFQFKMNQRYGALRKGKKQPYLDNFTQRALMDALSEEKPNLVLCHFTDLDSMRHEHGFDSEEAKAALVRHDQRLGEVMAFLEQDAFYQNATLVVLGDHASIDVNQVLSPNSFLKALGWLDVRRLKNKKFKAYAKSCDGSAYIYTNGLSVEEIETLKGNLEQFLAYAGGVEAIYDHEALVAMGADPNATFMLEAKSGFIFEEGHQEHYVMALEEHPLFKGQKTTAVHGYNPQKPNYTTVFMVKGPHVEEGVWLEHMDLVDVGPTIAPFVGVTLEQAEGINRRAFLKKEMIL
jgi:predicted AlkP superfamily pyrophosphatase or phosphodiesterase